MLVIIIVALNYPALQAVAYDQEYTSISSLPTRGINLLILLLIALAVVILIQVVGIILVIALLTLPAAITQSFSKTPLRMMIRSTITSMILTTTGIFLSWFLMSHQV